MRVRCIDDRVGLMEGLQGRLRVNETGHSSTSLTVGRVYEVLHEKHGFYRIIDDTGEAYYHPTEAFALLS